MAILINKENFEMEVLKSETPVVVDFFATWCPPCQRLAPVFDLLSMQIPGCKFVKVNIDNNHDLAVQHGIQSIPTLMFFKDGKALRREFPKSFNLMELKAQIEFWLKE